MQSGIPIQIYIESKFFDMINSNINATQSLCYKEKCDNTNGY